MTSTRMDPVALDVDFVSGSLSPATSKVERRLSDMRGMYAEPAALSDGNPLISEVLQYDVPPEPGQLSICTTVIHSGKVGREYYMTKGDPARGFQRRRARLACAWRTAGNTSSTAGQP